MNLFERFLSTPAAADTFGDAALLQGMLDFEGALARAQAAEGLIPADAAEAIRAVCRVEMLDIVNLMVEGSRAGTLVIPLVKQLRHAAGAAAAHVHHGATSQDVVDTAMVLATRRSLITIDADLGTVIAALSLHAEAHRDVPMLGRTLMQPALVVSVGFKLLGWTAPLVRARERLRRAASTALKVQLGGAVGTLSAMDGKGQAVARRMAADLGLSDDIGVWHTQRDEWISLACDVGLLCGSLGKIGGDLALLSQAEVGEMAEPSGEGRGGSSAMPHKRNPVGAMVAIAASLRAPHQVAALLSAMPQQHERGLGSWQAELAEWPGLFVAAQGAVAALSGTLPGLVIDADRMRRNIAALNDPVFAEPDATARAASAEVDAPWTTLRACAEALDTLPFPRWTTP